MTGGSELGDEIMFSGRKASVGSGKAGAGEGEGVAVAGISSNTSHE
jgi:hypothetical protein